jgi:hypothetical protein
MNAVPVVHHCEVTDTFGMQTMDRPHHVGGIHRVNQVCDDAVKVALENRDAQPKIQIVGGKRSCRPENQNFSRISGPLAENSKIQLKI